MDLSDRSLQWEGQAQLTAHLRRPVDRAGLDEIVTELESAITSACDKTGGAGNQ